jgi:hypothetical protein
MVEELCSGLGSLGSGRTIADVVADFKSGRLRELPNPDLERTDSILAALAVKPGRVGGGAKSRDPITHVVCIRIVKPAILSSIAALQQAVASLDAAVGEGLRPPASVHRMPRVLSSGLCVARVCF